MDLTTLGAKLGAFGNQLAIWAGTAFPNLLASILPLLGGWWLAAWTQRALSRFLDRQAQIDATLRSVTASLVRYTNPDSGDGRCPRSARHPNHEHPGCAGRHWPRNWPRSTGYTCQCCRWNNAALASALQNW